MIIDETKPAKIAKENRYSTPAQAGKFLSIYSRTATVQLRGGRPLFQ